MTARPRKARVRRLGVLLVTMLALTACSRILGGDGVGDPTPLPSAAAEPAGRTDPATDPTLARFYRQQLQWSVCGDRMQCAQVTVPVDWGTPDGDTLQLAVLRVQATGTRIGSLLTNPGGPGEGGVAWIKAAASTFGAGVRAAYDIVGWDPRGTGQSAPVRCLGDQQLDAWFASDATPDDPSEVQQATQRAAEFATACQQRSGPAFAHLDTLSTVRDMDVLRATLGDPFLSYYGASYGTYLGAWYAQTFPWRVGRLVLDGAVDPSLTSAQYAQGQALGFSRAVDAYVADCLANSGCPLRGTADDAKTQLRALIDRADQSPLPTASGRQLTQALLTVGLIRGLYSQSYWPTVSRGITQALRGDGTTLLALADSYYERDASGRYGQISIATNPIYCLDHPETRSVDQIGADARRLEQQYPPFGDAIGWGPIGCKVWPVPGVVPAQKLTAQGAAPILVVGTTKDPATPYEWAQSLAGQLASGRLLTRVGQGHTGYRQGNDCIDVAVNKYLVQGTVPAQGATCS